MARFKIRGSRAIAAMSLVGALLVPAAAVTSAGAQAASCFGRDATIVAVPGEVTMGTSGADVIVGTSGADDIRGRGGADRICAKGGADTVDGGSGNDRINLGSGNDMASGGRGADRILGKSGADTINGNGGKDLLKGNKGSDTINGGAKADVIRGGPGIDLCSGGPGADSLSSCNEAGPLTAGTHRIGTDIAPGRYVAQASRGCYWERISGFSGEFEDIITNEFYGFAGPTIVDIAAADRGFTFDGECGTFRPYRAPSKRSSTIVPGAHVVGSDIRPGTYRANVESECYWERRTTFSGHLADVTANEFYADSGRQFVTIESSDVGFFTNAECGTWTRQ